MLRITESENASHAKAYYTDGLAREDYYSQGQEIVGLWGGRAAKLLGLSGTVEREAFAALCDNKHPKTGNRLTPRTNADRRVGYDLNFHAPKSLSILHAITRDEALLKAFREAVDETMREVEGDMATRVRKGGRSEDRRTGNMVWAEFVHFTARPVDGHPDPHLHAHLYAINATWDPEERQWKAGQFGGIKQDARYFEAAFHARLAWKVRELGYPVARGAKGWEVAGVPTSAIDKFSRRTAQIERAAEERGITSAKAKDQLGASTRENKRKGLTEADLRTQWSGRLSPEERAALVAMKSTKDSGVRFGPQLEPAAALSHALSHAFERASTVPERAIIELSLRRGFGSIRVEDASRELADRKQSGAALTRIVEGRSYCTTRDVLLEEREMLAAARRGRGACRRLLHGEPTLPDSLGDDQRATALHILAAEDRAICVRGRAGTGKTTMMRAVVNALKPVGREVMAFAPTAQAAREVLKSDGFKAETLAALFANPQLQEAIRGQVLWVDEAGLIGTTGMRRLLELAEAKQARLILSGDYGQHASVERGDALRLLVQTGAIESRELTEIRRQRGTYRDAVASLAKGDTGDGIARLDELGAVREFPDARERGAALARDYVTSVKAGQSVLVVSPTHREAEVATAAIRGELRAAGMLGGNPADKTDAGRMLGTLRPTHWTDAEKRDPVLYSSGMILQFHQNAKGVARKGERMAVVHDRDGKPSILLSGQASPLPVKYSDRYQVFREEITQVVPGESLRVTQNGRSKDGQHRLHNGSVHRLQGFSPEGDLVLENGWVVSREFGHLTYGYVGTSHSSQGKTVDRVLVAESADSFAAASREQFYVSVSRGRQSLAIYTDDRDGLRRSIERSHPRLAAVELNAEPDKDRHRVHALTVERLRLIQQWTGRQFETIARGARRRYQQLISHHSRAAVGSGPPVHPNDAMEVMEKYGRHARTPLDFVARDSRGFER
jgi:conjugative relaxase-like TrwC/TraI family protein